MYVFGEAEQALAPEAVTEIVSNTAKEETSAPIEASVDILPTPSNRNLLRNEAELEHRLDILGHDMRTTFRPLFNYLANLIGKQTKSLKDWTAIGKDISDTPLTEAGKVKLRHRHELFAEKVIPQPVSLAYAFIPLIIFWIVKGYVGGKLHEKRIEDLLKKKSKRRREEQQAKKRARKASKSVRP